MVKVQGIDLKLGFDTGANTNVLDIRYRDEFFKKNYQANPTDMYYLLDIALRNVRVDNAPFLFMDMSSINSSPVRLLDGILSVSSLNADKVFFDTKKSRIHLFWSKNKHLQSLELTQETY